MTRHPISVEVARDPIIGADGAAFSPSHSRPPGDEAGPSVLPGTSADDEETPLLSSGGARKRKPFYRARPLWLVPFAITTACIRGMTLAPRVEVFTQLACASLHHDPYEHSTTPPSLLSYPLSPHSPPSPLLVPIVLNSTNGERHPDTTPPTGCMQDPDVQASAARIQTVMTTTMGILSVLTTGWWGHFGERHGRVKVLGLATLGLILTDLTFILVSSPSRPFGRHSDKLLLIAPVIEGLMGGWSTLQSATSAYISDCTSPGSRSHIFSRFTGAFFIGICVGPSLGGLIIRSYSSGTHKSVTEVFWYAAAGSTLNLLLCLFLFPESLSKDKQEKAMVQYTKETSKKGKARATNVDGDDDLPSVGIVGRFFGPLKMFLPAMVPDASGTKMKKDWSLTFLAAALFGYFLSTGIYQLKYLYGAHSFGWGADQLSYYVSAMGGSRALFLLLILPAIIKGFKPVPKPTGKGKATPRVTTAMLGREIQFDLALTKISFFVDILSDVLIVAFPVSPYKVNQLDVMSASSLEAFSGTLFVVASSLSGFGSGVVPAVQSLALCILQARNLASGQTTNPEEDTNTGKLFGAMAVMQASGQMIIGPLLFGLIYSGTVAVYAKAIFVTAGCILFLSLLSVILVRNPIEKRPSLKRRQFLAQKERERLAREAADAEDVERGRSRVSKDLFGGRTRPVQKGKAKAKATPSGSGEVDDEIRRNSAPM